MLHIFVIDGCPYCENTLNLTKKYKIKADVTVVPPQQKQQYKSKHGKNTFPHIFYKSDKNSRMKLIGGNNEYENLLSALYIIKKTELPTSVICNLLKNLT